MLSIIFFEKKMKKMSQMLLFVTVVPGALKLNRAIPKSIFRIKEEDSIAYQTLGYKVKQQNNCFGLSHLIFQSLEITSLSAQV